MVITLDFQQLKNLSGDNAVVDVACPFCGPSRRSKANQIRKVLRIWDRGDFITFTCARCGETGYAKEDCASGKSYTPRQATQSATEPDDKSELAQYLWGQSGIAAGTAVELYLSSRKCWRHGWPNIRYLPPRGKHKSAMICRFGQAAVTGIHLTRLTDDGFAKAGTDKDKIMIGPSVGQPIAVNEGGGQRLAITEGIEDAATVACAAGWTCWAAGSAARIPKLAEASKPFGQVYVFLDDDESGRKGCTDFQRARCDAIAVDPSRIYGRRMDINRVMMERGSDAVLRVIDYCEIQHQFDRGLVTQAQFMKFLNRIGRLP